MAIAIIVALAVGFIAAKMTIGSSAGAQLQAKQKELDVACRDAEKFRSRCKEMQEEIDKLLSENRKLHSTRKSMEDNGFDMEDKLDDAKRELKKLREQNEKLSLDLRESRAACEDYEREIVKLKK